VDGAAREVIAVSRGRVIRESADETIATGRQGDIQLG